MVEQLRGPFEKFVDSLYSKKISSPHLHKVPTRSSKSYDGTFSLRHHVQTGSGVHPASYPMDTGGSFSRGVELTTHLHLEPRLRMRGATHPLPNTSLWGGA
jgi:hypothetical protein